MQLHNRKTHISTLVVKPTVHANIYTNGTLYGHQTLSPVFHAQIWLISKALCIKWCLLFLTVCASLYCLPGFCKTRGTDSSFACSLLQVFHETFNQLLAFIVEMIQTLDQPDVEVDNSTTKAVTLACGLFVVSLEVISRQRFCCCCCSCWCRLFLLCFDLFFKFFLSALCIPLK